MLQRSMALGLGRISRRMPPMLLLTSTLVLVGLVAAHIATRVAMNRGTPPQMPQGLHGS